MHPVLPLGARGWDSDTVSKHSLGRRKRGGNQLSWTVPTGVGRSNVQNLTAPDRAPSAPHIVLLIHLCWRVSEKPLCLALGQAALLSTPTLLPLWRPSSVTSFFLLNWLSGLFLKLKTLVEAQIRLSLGLSTNLMVLFCKASGGCHVFIAVLMGRFQSI